MRAKKLEQHLTGHIAAVSVGVVDGRPVLDLPYEEDSRAEVDLNVVATESGHYVELQGTAEQEPFHRDALDAMLTLADKGIADLIKFQRATVDGAR
jgi:ribonuclease PH